MFFKEISDLPEALMKVETDLLPHFVDQVNLAHATASDLGDAEPSHGYFSLLTSKLILETETMSRMLNILLFPLIKNIVNQNKSEFKCIESFTVLKTYHNRILKVIKELREGCNQYVLSEAWSEYKRESCLYVHSLELSFLNYVNFMEGTFFPLLAPFCIQNQVN